MPPTDKPTCAGKVWSRYNYIRCLKSGSLEHGGVMWCKTHHPPTVEAKTQARLAKYESRFEQQQRVWRDKRISDQLQAMALDWLRRDNPAIVREWEAELSAKK